VYVHTHTVFLLGFALRLCCGFVNPLFNVPYVIHLMQRFELSYTHHSNAANKLSKAMASNNLKWSADAFSDVTKRFLYNLVCCCYTTHIHIYTQSFSLDKPACPRGSTGDCASVTQWALQYRRCCGFVNPFFNVCFLSIVLQVALAE